MDLSTLLQKVNIQDSKVDHNDPVNHTRDVLILKPSVFGGELGVIEEYLPTMYRVSYVEKVQKLVNDKLIDYSKNQPGDLVQVNPMSQGVISKFIASSYILGCEISSDIVNMGSKWIQEDSLKKMSYDKADKFYVFNNLLYHEGPESSGIVKGVLPGDLSGLNSWMHFKTYSEGTRDVFDQTPEIIHYKGVLGKVSQIGRKGGQKVIVFHPYTETSFMQHSTNVNNITKEESDLFVFGIGNSVVVYSGNVIKGVTPSNHTKVIPELLKAGTMEFVGEYTGKIYKSYGFVHSGEYQGSYCPIVGKTGELVEIHTKGEDLFSKKQLEWDSVTGEGKLKGQKYVKSKIIKKVYKHANIKIKGVVHINHRLTDGSTVNFERIHYMHDDGLYTDSAGGKHRVEIIKLDNDNNFVIKIINPKSAKIESFKILKDSPSLLIYSDFQALNPQWFGKQTKLHRAERKKPMDNEPMDIDEPEHYLPSPEHYMPDSPGLHSPWDFAPSSPVLKDLDSDADSFKTADSDSEGDADSEAGGDVQKDQDFTSTFKDMDRITVGPDELNSEEKDVYNRILKVLRMVKIDHNNMTIKPVIDAYLGYFKSIYNVFLDNNEDDDFTLEERIFLLLPLIYNAIVEITDLSYDQFLFKVLGIKSRKEKGKLKLYTYSDSDLSKSIWLRDDWYDFSDCLDPRHNLGNDALNHIVERVWCWLFDKGVVMQKKVVLESFPLTDRKVIGEYLVSETELMKPGYSKRQLTKHEIGKLDKEAKEMAAGVLPGESISTVQDIFDKSMDPQELKEGWADYWAWQDQMQEESQDKEDKRQDESKTGKVFKVIGKEREPVVKRSLVAPRKKISKLQRLHPHTDFSLKGQMKRVEKQLLGELTYPERARLEMKLNSLQQDRAQEQFGELTRKFKDMSVKERKQETIKNFLKKTQQTEKPSVYTLVKANWKNKVFINTDQNTPDAQKAKKLLRILYTQLRQL